MGAMPMILVRVGGLCDPHQGWVEVVLCAELLPNPTLLRLGLGLDGGNR